MFDKSTILSTKKVTLRLLKIEDADELFKVSNDISIFDYFPVRLSNESELKHFIVKSLKSFAKEEVIPFVIINNETNEIIGSTSFMAISECHKRVEIGSTWLSKNFQGKGFNKPCKYLLLRYAFEQWELERVEFKTDVLNQQSRKAIGKIGAAQEGIFKNHMTMFNNRRRDSVYYAIVKDEWKEIKNRIFKDIANENTISSR